MQSRFAGAEPGCGLCAVFSFLSMKQRSSEEHVRLSRRGLGTAFAPGRVLAGGLLLLGMGFALSWLAAGARLERAAGAASTPFLPFSAAGAQQAPRSYRGLPLIFEANLGQSDAQVRFLARGAGYGLFLTENEAVLSMRTGGQRSASSTQHSAKSTFVVRMKLANANPAPQLQAGDPLPGKSNYFIGNDSTKWHRAVPQFARVRYEQVYPGIDLVYYGRQGQLEYDFEVAPGADPRAVGLRFQGPEKLTLDKNGDLLLVASSGEVRLRAPRTYQKFGEEERTVPGRFVLRAADEVGFEVGDYDRSRTLVIDPVVSYSTYLGGTADEACSIISGAATAGCPAIAVDAAGSAYIAGATTSTDFPVTTGVVQGTPGGAADVFVTKFNATGSALLFSTYLGGSGDDTSVGIAIDRGFNVVVAGNTDSTNFPTDGTVEAYQAGPPPAGTHAFVSELDSAGATLLYSTYLFGSGTDTAKGIALDVKNKAYVMGSTTSKDFPTTVGAFQTTPKAPNVTNQFFFSKLDPSVAGLSSLAYSTYLGGSTPIAGVTEGGGIAVDTSTTPNVFVTGGTDFSDMPAVNGAQPGKAAGVDAFIAKFTPENASGAQEVYLTYAGGGGDDIGYGVAVDSGGNAYITGSTTSTDFPTAGTAFQAANGGSVDAFVSKVNNPTEGTSVAFTYFSYIGGAGDEVGYGIAVDSSQGAHITGSTTSANFPFTANATQQTFGGVTDAFVARLDTTSTANFATYLGGELSDIGTGIAVDPNSTYVAGETTSTVFPVKLPYQSAIKGTSDAFVAKLGPSVALTFDPAPTASPSPAGVGNQVTFTYSIKNTGDLTSGITFTDTLPATGTTFVSATSTPGSCGTPTGTPPTVTCSIGALATNGTAKVTIVLTPTVAGPLANSGVVTVQGTAFQAQGSASTTVNDFAVSAAPASVSVTAGASASYTVTITPSPTFPNSISLSCSSGLPAESTCKFSTNPLPNANNGPATSALSIATTIRPITGQLGRGSLTFYAMLLPIGGLVVVGVGARGGKSRWRRVLGGLLTSIVLTLIVFQAACGSSSNATTPTGGTPAGTYPVTITATSGSATRTTSVTLVVE